jgi:hypothetical protein
VWFAQAKLVQCSLGTNPHPASPHLLRLGFPSDLPDNTARVSTQGKTPTLEEAQIFMREKSNQLSLLKCKSKVTIKSEAKNQVLSLSKANLKSCKLCQFLQCYSNQDIPIVILKANNYKIDFLL